MINAEQSLRTLSDVNDHEVAGDVSTSELQNLQDLPYSREVDLNFQEGPSVDFVKKTWWDVLLSYYRPERRSAYVIFMDLPQHKYARSFAVLLLNLEEPKLYRQIFHSCTLRFHLIKFFLTTLSGKVCHQSISGGVHECTTFLRNIS